MVLVEMELNRTEESGQPAFPMKVIQFEDQSSTAA